MSSLFRRAVLLLLPLSIPSILAHASANFTPPAPNELSMTAEPKAPGAPAIVLSYDQTDDATSAEVSIHVRIKILTSGGLSAANIDLPDSVVFNDNYVPEIFARTVHTDGSIIAFTSTPQNSVTSTGAYGVSHRVISLTGVEVGSILEYICHFQTQNTIFTRLIGFHSPVWELQGHYFVREAHFTLFTPYGVEKSYVRWVANLPSGVTPLNNKGKVTLDVKDIPAIPDEEFMPPANAALYNVRFFYYSDTRDKYWATSGDNVDAAWSDFYVPRKALVAAVKDLTLPTDTDDQKLRKLYKAVMQLENTDLTRQRKQVEDKRSGLREAQNSEDIWLRKRGDSYDLTLLFIALARSAGFQAYPMAVASRDHAVFDQNVLSWSQMDSMLAIVNVKGHELFLDPGTRLCPFGHVAPWHANVIGVSSEGKLIKTRYTPKETFNDSHITRTAKLTLAHDGSVSGTLSLTWSGNSALRLRREALRNDRSETEASLLRETQSSLPKGVDLKLSSLQGLDDGEVPLIANFTASGILGSSTKTRLVLPAQFFESSARPLLVPSQRTLPVQFPEAYSVRDFITIDIPDDLTVESMRESQSLSVQNDTLYKTSAARVLQKSSIADAPPTPMILAQRIFVLSRIDYPTQDDLPLHAYFGQVATHDQEQIILRVQPKATPAN